jgi:uncharacterized membrane protein
MQMGRAEKSNKYKKVSVWNWMGTLIVCSIPGVNVIALILMIILAKAQAKRSFAIAMLLLWILCAALVFAGFIVFGPELSQFAAYLRGGDAVNLLVMPQG